jgi:predicted nucleotidyltransferase
MFEELLGSLDTAGVRFVVVGGVAVVIHGYARLTADLDLVVDLDPANARLAVDTLTLLGLRPTLPVRPTDFADPAIRQGWIERHNLEVFSMHDPRNPMLTVDLFAREPLPFEELWSAAHLVTLRGRTIHIASVEHLIAMKRRSARPQDLADIEKLEALARRRHAD